MKLVQSENGGKRISRGNGNTIRFETLQIDRRRIDTSWKRTRRNETCRMWSVCLFIVVKYIYC